MVRRPLCLACAAFVVVFMLLLSAFPPDPMQLGEYEGKVIVLQGRIIKKEWKNGRLSLTLDTIMPDSSLSIYKPPDRVLCRMAEGTEQKDFNRLGSTIRVTGRAESFPRAGNAGEFDQSVYYQARKIDFQMKDARSIEQSQSYLVIDESLYGFRERLLKVYDSVFPPMQTGVMKAMVLGASTELDAEIKEVYQKSGIAHLLVISGQHISMIGMGIYLMLRKSTMSKISASCLSIILIYLYAVMTGMGSSTIRSITMFAIYLSADLVNRTYDMITAMALTAVMILFWQPMMVFQPGFQLSFGAVMGIGLLYPTLQKFMTKKNKINSLVLSSFSISYFTLPIIMFSYSSIPAYSILLNLIAVPLMSILLPLGIFLIPIFALSVDLAQFLSFPCQFILKIYQLICELNTIIPGNTLITGRPMIVQILIFYAGILALILILEKGNRICAVMMLSLLAMILFWKNTVPCAVTMFDVGQGDCILIEAEGKNILIDAGSTSKNKTGQYQIIPALKALGIRQLDMVIATHADQDHVSAIPELISFCLEENGMKIKTLVMSEKMKEEEGSVELAEYADQAGISVKFLNKGDVISGTHMKLICLNPDVAGSIKDPNEASIALWFEFKNFKALFTGDITGEGEIEMIEFIEQMEEKGESVRIDYLKVSHHGSESSTPVELLALTNPVAAFISCGENNTYGHPHRELTDRLLEQHIPIFSTAKSGQIRVTTDGEKMVVKRYYGEDND
ncbi:MAG: DNA internalization-related competence protein ComEC/Rec2 [Lachnospiraceae bacterium]|nr:DNA internalization-related competence protein ComEC/Rec2 [Lachnospiraceae bacterium]